MNIRTANFRFYEELNDFLSNDKLKKLFPYRFSMNSTLRTIIANMGVPLTEIDLILVNGESVDFNYRPQDNDRIAVFPRFEAFDISSIAKLRAQPLRQSKFILDAHLGRLAKYLRLLGFDTLFDPYYEDSNIAKIAAEQHRIVLTRDRQLLMNNLITHGYWVRAIQPAKQVREVLVRFDLYAKIDPFTRCLRCNSKLISIAKDTIKAQLPPKTKLYYQLFLRCNKCEKIYWQGSHYTKMKAFIASLSMESAPS